MAHTVVEVKFAQNLAANERRTRDKALKKLKKYLRLKSSKKDGFKEEDFLKLWKGLHYCLWMQDKPLIQEELSNTLAKLVHELQDADARFLFLHTFFTTEAREWNSLDIWRIDKFMMLMRNVLHELLVLVQKESWSEESISHLVDIVKETGLHHYKDSIPDGIKIHLADIYMEEVEKVANEKLDGRKLLQLLEPFCNFILKAQNTVLVKRVISRVFEPILTTAANTLKGSNQEEYEEKKEHYSIVKFDNRLLAERLFQLSLGNECLSRNRPLIYDFVKSAVMHLKDADGLLTLQGLIRLLLQEHCTVRSDLSDPIFRVLKQIIVADVCADGSVFCNMSLGRVDNNFHEYDSRELCRLRAVEEGVLPEDDKTDIKPGLKYQDYNDAIQSLTKLHTRERKNQIEHLKKKKKGVPGKETGDAMNNNVEYSQATNIFTESVDSPPVQKDTQRKRKHPEGTDSAITEQSHIKLKKQFTSFDSESEKNGQRSGCFSSASAAPSSEISSHDQAKESPRKRQQSDNLGSHLFSKTFHQDLVRSENATEGMSSLKRKTPPSRWEILKKATLNADSDTSDKGFKTVIKVTKGKKKSIWAETPISDGMENTANNCGMNERKDNVKSYEFKKDVSCDQKLSAAGNRSKCEWELIEKGKDDSCENSKIVKMSPKKNSDIDNTKSDNISKLGTTQLDKVKTEHDNSDVMQDGEIEIWVPNKKFKATKSSESAFAKFEKARIPAAFVKKAFSTTKKQPPGHVREEGRDSNRISTIPSKKVQFDMKKNKALAFKDSLHISPVLPFHPDKKPDQGILKSTPEAVAYKKTCPRQHRPSLTPEHRSSLVKSASTPVTDVAMKQKRSFTRAKAADFFL